jgi:hypothetical protein
VAHVVAVSEVGDADACDGPESLPDGHHVGKRLAGVELVREAVDNGHLAVLGERVDVGLAERPDHYRVQVSREDDGGVADRLAAAELQVVRGEVEADAPELRDPDLEADPCASRGLLEDHPEGSAREERAVSGLSPRLQAVGEVEHGRELVRLPVVHAQEISPFEVARGHWRILRPERLDRKTLRFYSAGVVRVRRR